jgi:hypothetical protein
LLIIWSWSDYSNLGRWHQFIVSKPLVKLSIHRWSKLTIYGSRLVLSNLTHGDHQNISPLVRWHSIWKIFISRRGKHPCSNWASMPELLSSKHNEKVVRHLLFYNCKYTIVVLYKFSWLIYGVCLADLEFE